MGIEKKDINKKLQSIDLPDCFNSRKGWAEFLELKRIHEPHVHQIEPTNHCPYTCIMCPRTKNMDREMGFMDLNLYKKIIDEISSYSDSIKSKEIELFHFGESLLHPKIIEMIKYASEQKLKITLSVNGPHLTPFMSLNILKEGAYKLIISIDGYDEESYKVIRGKSADYNKAVRNIENLINIHSELKSSTIICVRIIVMDINENHSAAFCEKWKFKGIETEIREFFPWGEKEMVKLGKFEKLPHNMPCPFPWQYLVIQWNGDIVPCCRDQNGVLKMGNVMESSLKEIWNSKKYEFFRNNHSDGDYSEYKKCKNCMEIYSND